jgi:hypothetical protein
MTKIEVEAMLKTYLPGKYAQITDTNDGCYLCRIILDFGRYASFDFVEAGTPSHLAVWLYGIDERGETRKLIWNGLEPLNESGDMDIDLLGKMLKNHKCLT